MLGRDDAGGNDDDDDGNDDGDGANDGDDNDDENDTVLKTTTGVGTLLREMKKKTRSVVTGVGLSRAHMLTR